jgi:hypothetical protein
VHFVRIGRVFGGKLPPVFIHTGRLFFLTFGACLAAVSSAAKMCTSPLAPVKNNNRRLCP